jgi:hypothetical protein
MVVADGCLLGFVSGGRLCVPQNILGYSQAEGGVVTVEAVL